MCVVKCITIKIIFTMIRIKLTLLSCLICFGFTACEPNDEHTNDSGNNVEQVDYSSLIPGHWTNSDVEWPITETISINNRGFGTISCQDLVNQEYGVMANGTYKLDGDKIVATYNDVRVDTENGDSSYHGFTDGQTRSITYTIVSCDGAMMKLSVSGKTSSYEKYADVN